MVKLNNETLAVSLNPKGAELTSLFNKETRLEYMWGGDPAIWGKHSPVLFPIVGTMKADTYLYRGKSYHLPRHGFARERQFTVESQTNDEAIFSFVSDESTLAVFPFAFRFRIKYALLNDSLSVSYEVLNTGDDDMYFSVGAHPAFKLPLAEGTAYQDYYLEFETPESTGRWPISADGLIETASQPLLENSATLPLTRELFSRDALVMKGLKSSVVSLRSAKTPHGLEFEFPGFPFLGLWAAKGGDFVCIEPWCGIADPVTTNQQLDTKEGINKLVKGEKFLRSWVVRVF